MSAKRITVYCLDIEDKPGSLHKLLAQAALAKVDLLCLAAFSAGMGTGRVFLGAKEPATLMDCAKQMGLDLIEVAGFILGGEDKIGAAAEAIQGLAQAGINGVATAAIVCDGQYHMGVVVDASDGDAAEKALS